MTKDQLLTMQTNLTLIEQHNRDLGRFMMYLSPLNRAELGGIRTHIDTLTRWTKNLVLAELENNHE